MLEIVIIFAGCVALAALGFLVGNGTANGISLRTGGTIEKAE